jgi:hypothetical protein
MGRHILALCHLFEVPVKKKEGLLFHLLPEVYTSGYGHHRPPALRGSFLNYIAKKES